MKPSPFAVRRSAVEEFMRAFNQRIITTFDNAENKDALLRADLHREEFNEYNDSDEVVDTLDAIIDIEYIAHGTMLTLGIQQHDNLADTAPRVSFPAANAYVITELNKPRLCKKGLVASLNQLIACCSQAGMLVTRHYHDAFMHVHMKNMSKLWSEDDMHDYLDNVTEPVITFEKKGSLYLAKRTDGKIMKPPTFTPPNLKEFVE
jgi:hypothetical protein